MEAAVKIDDFEQAEILYEEVQKYQDLKNELENAKSDKKYGKAKILKPQVEAASKPGGLKAFLVAADKRIADEKAEKERLGKVNATNQQNFQNLKIS